MKLSKLPTPTKQHLAGVCDQEASRTNYPPQHLALGRESMLQGWSGLATCARSKARPTPKMRPSAHTFFSGASTRVRECVACWLPCASYLQVPPRACGEEGERMHARDTYCCFARTSCCNCARETGWTEFDKHACQHCKFVNACFDA